MLYQSWWKILGVFLLVYTFLAGLLVPLKPGIVSVSPSSARVGEELELRVSGYNTRYTQSRNALRAWLKMDDTHALQAHEVQIIDDRQLRLVFSLPTHLPAREAVRDFTLVLDDPYNGASVLPSAVFVTQADLSPEQGEKVFQNAPLRGLHDKAGIDYPFRNILKETIRNTYFHVPLWFAMIFLFLYSFVQSIRYLRTGDADADLRAQALTMTGILYGVLGLLTGAIWAKHTWGAYWSWDVKQNMTAVALLIYLAYFVLRGSFEDPEKKARLSAVYTIFAFCALIPLIYVVPRLTDSLHPGSGGNPAFGSDDLDNTMRLVFYPAIIGWTLLGFWAASLAYRYERLKMRMEEM